MIEISILDKQQPFNAYYDNKLIIIIITFL